jgi:septal ring factor EnvC (AmiA/AmiB activator)
MFERIAELEESASRADALRVQLQAAQEALATATRTPVEAADDPETTTELARLEGMLKERAEKIQSIERALQESERIGRALARELQTATTREPPPETAPDERTARYEADLHAAQWKLAAIESELSEYRDTANDHDALAQALTAAQATIATMQPK